MPHPLAVRLAGIHLGLRTGAPFLAALAAWVLGEPEWILWAWLPGVIYLAVLHTQVRFPGDLPRSLLLFSPLVIGLVDTAPRGLPALASATQGFAAIEFAALLLALAWPLVWVRPTGGLGVSVGVGFAVLGGGLAVHVFPIPEGPLAVAGAVVALLLETAWMAPILTRAARGYVRTGTQQDAPLDRGDGSWLEIGRAHV